MDLANWAIALLVVTTVWIVAVIVVGRLWRAAEKPLLVLAGVGACFVIILAVFVLVAALARPANLTVRNESRWPIEVSGLNIGTNHVIEQGDSKKFYQDAGPGWIAGFIDDVEIAGGPSGTSRVLLSNMDAGKNMEIVVTEATLGLDGGE
jgi:hypothetical protein